MQHKAYIFYFTDTHLNDSDSVLFKANKDSFLQMTSVKAITERCIQRAVIPNERGMEVIEHLEQEGQKKATGTC